MGMSLLLGSAAALVAVTAAQAADLPVKAPAYKPLPSPVAYSWTGFYIGGHIGGSRANVDWTHTNTDGIVETFNQDDGGFVYGVHGGAMYQFNNNIVVGMEGTYSRRNLSDTSVATLSVDRSNSFDLKNTATVVGRLGYAWDRWLVYGQGGWATAKTDFRRFETSTNATTASSSSRDDGWTVGVGAAYAIHNNIILGIEYDFIRTNIGNRIDTVAPGITGTESDKVTNAHADIHQVIGRLSFKFP